MSLNTKTTLFFSTSQKDGMTQAIFEKKKREKKSRNLKEPASLHEVMVINEHWHHYQCQRLAEKVGVYPDPERKLSAACCLFMSHHKHWCFERIRQLSFHRGNEGTASERGTRWLSWEKLNPCGQWRFFQRTKPMKENDELAEMWPFIV